MRYSTMKRQLIAVPQRLFIVLAINDNDGQLYGIDMSGGLYKIDKKTGAETFVGNTGITPSNYHQAADRFLRITDFLTKAEKHHGAFSHFMDGRTGKTVPFFGPRDNGGDLVETSFMTQGLLAARQYFNGENEKENTIRERIDSIWEGIEWKREKRRETEADRD